MTTRTISLGLLAAALTGAAVAAVVRARRDAGTREWIAERRRRVEALIEQSRRRVEPQARRMYERVEPQARRVYDEVSRRVANG